MIAVLDEADEPLRTHVIYDCVVERLGEPKPTYGHVRDFLSHRSRGDRRLFERLGYGTYRLPRRKSVEVGFPRMFPSRLV
jgi:hypothetical protein